MSRAGGAVREAWDEADNMCPNCITPWKCNGPHLSDETVAAERHRNDPPTLTIPDDPEAIALVLCRDHLDCRDHIGGHDAYIWQAKRLLADLRRLT